MKIVINIPDEQIEKCLEESKYIHEDEGEKGFVDITLLYTNKSLEFVDIVRKHDFYSLKANYKILPKGHGRLKDFDKIEWYGCDFEGRGCIEAKGDCSVCNYANCYAKQVRELPTIIEADEESELNESK